MIGGIEETSASFEARSAPRSYPTDAHRGRSGSDRARLGTPTACRPHQVGAGHSPPGTAPIGPKRSQACENRRWQIAATDTIIAPDGAARARRDRGGGFRVVRVRANGAQSLVAGGTAAMFIVAMERTARTLY
jgi:hypothetical protein